MLSVIESNNYIIYLINFILLDYTPNSENRISNYIFQILNKSYEGSFQIAAYDFESVKENRQHLLDTKHQTYFSKNKVAKLVADHEIYRTNNYQ